MLSVADRPPNGYSRGMRAYLSIQRWSLLLLGTTLLSLYGQEPLDQEPIGSITDVVTARVVAIATGDHELGDGQQLDVLREGEVVGRLEVVRAASGICRVLEGEAQKGDLVRRAIADDEPDEPPPDDAPPEPSPAPGDDLPPGLRQAMQAQGALEVALPAADQLPTGEQERLADTLTAARELLPRLYPAARLTLLDSPEVRVAAALAEAGQDHLIARWELPPTATDAPLLAPLWPALLPADQRPTFGQLPVIDSSPHLWGSLDRWEDSLEAPTFGGWSFDDGTLIAAEPAVPIVRRDFQLADLELSGEVRLDQGNLLYLVLRSGIIIKFHGAKSADRPGGVSVRYGRRNLAVVDAASEEAVLRNGTWHRFRIHLQGDTLRLSIDDEEVLNTEITTSIMGEATATPRRGYLGFGAYQASGAFREVIVRGLSQVDRLQMPRLRQQRHYEPTGDPIAVLELPTEDFVSLTNDQEEPHKAAQHVVDNGKLTIRGASFSQFSARGLASEHWQASGRLRFLRRGTAWFRVNRRLLFGLEAVRQGRTEEDATPFLLNRNTTDYRSVAERHAGDQLVTDRWYEWELEYHHPIATFRLDGEQVMQSSTIDEDEAGPSQLGISAYIARLEIADLTVQPLVTANRFLKLRPDQVEGLLREALAAAEQAASHWEHDHPLAAATIRGNRPPVLATRQEIEALAIRFREQHDWPHYLELLEANYQRFEPDSEAYTEARRQWQVARQKYDIALEMAQIGDLGLDGILRVGEAPGPLATANDRRHLWIAIPAIDGLVRYDPLERQIVQRLELPFRPAQMAALGDQLLLVHEDLRQLHLLDTATGELVDTLELSTGKALQLATDPLRGRAWLSIDENEPDTTKIANYRIYQVETAPLALTPTDAIGMFMAADPLGRFLYTGVSVQLTPTLDPSFLMAVPVRGYLDHLLAYRLTGDELELIGDRPAPGVAGTAIVPDPSGRYVAYVARGGFWFNPDPRRTGPKIALFPAANLRGLGPLLETGTGVQQFVCHPHRPLAYAYDGRTLLKIDLETGERLGEVPLPEDIARQAVAQLLLSASARELAIAYSGQPGGVYLHRLQTTTEADPATLPPTVAGASPTEQLEHARAALTEQPEQAKKWLARLVDELPFTPTGEAAAELLIARTDSPLLVQAPAPPQLPPAPASDLADRPTSTPPLPVASPGEAAPPADDAETEGEDSLATVLASLRSFLPLADQHLHTWLWRCLQTAGPHAESPRLQLLVAEAYRRAGEAAAARTMASRVLAGESVDSRAASRAYALLAGEAPNAAERQAALHQAIAIEPRNPFLHQRFGDACQAAGQPNRAAHHWLLSYALYPSQHALRQQLEELDLLEPSAAVNALPIAELYRRVSPSVLLIRQKVGVGTGFFITRDGMLFTNQHVVGEGEDLTVSFQPRGEDAQVTLPATVLRSDPQRDMALLQVQLGEREIEPLVIGTPPEPVAGEEVIAIGNPGMGSAVLTQTITEGIISNLNRQVGGQRYLQTSAAVNPGNSGGPLFNRRGHVIGMVTLKAQLDNVGFAIPADILLGFVADTVDY